MLRIIVAVLCLIFAADLKASPQVSRGALNETLQCAAYYRIMAGWARERPEHAKEYSDFEAISLRFMQGSFILAKKLRMGIEDVPTLYAKIVKRMDRETRGFDPKQSHKLLKKYGPGCWQILEAYEEIKREQAT